MRKKLNIFLMLILCVSLVLGGCGNKEETKPAEPVDDSAQSESVETESGERTIEDNAGNTVVIPPADEIERVVIISPPMISVFTSVVKDTNKIVGAHPGGLASANPQLLDEMVPNWKDIDTTFLTGFASNTEELLKLKPDIILVYGDFQKEGLENIKIPVVDFFITDMVNEKGSIKYESLMREIFDVNDDNTLESEWEKANARVDDILKDVEGDTKQKGLMIMNNTGDKITVRASGTYGDDWLLKSGLANAAGEIEGDSIEVTMEQIYEWNPDIVYVFNGIPATEYLNNNINGQDWSKVEAFNSDRIYNTPKGMFNWGAPCSDSPLMLQWMVSKNFPNKLSEEEFKIEMSDYYSRRYDIDLTGDLMDSILNPKTEK